MWPNPQFPVKMSTGLDILCELFHNYFPPVTFICLSQTKNSPKFSIHDLIPKIDSAEFTVFGRPNRDNYSP